MTERKYLGKTDGFIAKSGGYSQFKMLMDILLFPEYSFADIYHYVRGSLVSLKMLEQGKFWELKLDQQSTDFKIPVYLLMGESDYTTPVILAEEYFKVIKAPEKRFIKMQNSAHLANAESPDMFNRHVIELFNKH